LLGVKILTLFDLSALTPKQPTADQLKAQAKYWHNVGLSVIPVAIYWNEQQGKWAKNLSYKWRKFNHKLQTIEEFNSINWNGLLCRNPSEKDSQKKTYDQINGLAIITTLKAFNGKYLGVIDYDPKGKASEAAKALGKRIFDKIMSANPTLTESTVNNGLHLYYWSDIPCDYNSNYILVSCMELLGGSRCVITAPTIGYKIISPTVNIGAINDIQHLFISNMKLHSVPTNLYAQEKINKQIPSKQQSNNGNMLEYKIRPCITEALKRQLTSGSGHRMRLAIVAEHKKAGCNDKDIIDLFRDQPDFNEEITQVQVASVKQLIHKCGSIKAYGYCIYTSRAECPWIQQFKRSQAEKHQDIIERLATDFRSKYIFKTPKDTEELHRYKDGIYVPCIQELRTEIETELLPKISTRTADEVLKKLVWGSYAERCEFNKYTGLIPVNNGLVNVASLRDNTFPLFKPYDESCSEHIFTYKLPVTYDSTAQCPIFTVWFEDVQPNPKNRLCLMEFAGHNLINHRYKHAFFWLLGKGRNGKGTYIRTISNIFGTDNVSNVKLHEISPESRFALARLYGKLINVSNEPTTERNLDTSYIKEITGGDTIDAELKNIQKALRFECTTDLYVLCNEIPDINDRSDAFWERVIFILWPKQYLRGSGQKPDIERQWLDIEGERSGIFNLMIAGLRRLFTQEDFTISDSQTQITLEQRRKTDSCVMWIKERTMPDRAGEITRDEAYASYVEYCEQYNLLVKQPKDLYKAINEIEKYPESYPMRNNKRTRGFKNISIKTPIDTENKEQLDSYDVVNETQQVQQVNAQTLTGFKKPIHDEKIKSEVPYEKAVLAVAPVAKSQLNTPAVYFMRIVQGGKCENCGEYLVEYRVKPPSLSEIYRCSVCFEKLRRKLSKAQWIELIES